MNQRYSALAVPARGTNESGYFGVIYDRKEKRNVRVCTLIVSYDRAERIAKSMLNAFLKGNDA